MLQRGEDSSDVAGQTALTLRRLAAVERMLGRTEEAAKDAERAVALLRPAPGAPPSPLPAAEVIRASYLAGSVAQELGEYEKAQRHLREALAIPVPQPADDETRELRMTTRGQLAQLCMQGGDFAAARTEYREVLRECQEMVASGLGGLDLRRNLRFAEYGLGEMARQEGRFGEARTHLEASIRFALEL